MKKILITLTVVFLAFTSCEEKLDLPPNDVVTSDVAFQNTTDLQSGLNGIYAEYNPDNIIDYSSIFTDDTKIGADNGGQKVALHNQIVNPGSADVDDIWLSNYGMINSINRVLAAAATITPTLAEQDQYNKIIADCYALRALAHFELLQFYSTDYNSGTLAVPYTKTVGVFEEPARLTTEEVFAEIENDLVASEALLDPTYFDPGYVTVDFITALRARVALYSGNYADAITHSQTLITKYPLATTTQYTGMFQDTDNTEVIFKHLRVVDGDPRVGGIWHFTGTGGGFMEMSNGLYNALQADSGVRFSVNLDPNSDPANNLHLIGKYLGKNGLDYLNDVKVFRVSEMYLINAEAKVMQSSDYTGAATMISDLRTARGSATSTPTYTTNLEAITDILAERRVELAYEGHRFLDLKRTRNITNLGISRDAADCGGATPCSLPVTDHRFTLPIPDNETNANSNMVQNPGY